MEDRIENLARVLAFDDVRCGRCATLTSALSRLHGALGRLPCESEKRKLIARYGHWCREFKRTGYQIFVN